MRPRADGIVENPAARCNLQLYYLGEKLDMIAPHCFSLDLLLPADIAPKIAALKALAAGAKRTRRRVACPCERKLIIS
jgi:hypothetical protein